MGLLEEAIRSARGRLIRGDAVFKLYDTFGFQLTSRRDIARERGLSIDEAGFEGDAKRSENGRVPRASSASELRGGVSVEGRTDFSGYDGLTDQGRVVEVIKGGTKGRAAAGG